MTHKTVQCLKVWFLFTLNNWFLKKKLPDSQSVSFTQFTAWSHEVRFPNLRNTILQLSFNDMATSWTNRKEFLARNPVPVDMFVTSLKYGQSMKWIVANKANKLLPRQAMVWFGCFVCLCCRLNAGYGWMTLYLYTILGIYAASQCGGVCVWQKHENTLWLLQLSFS